MCSFLAQDAIHLMQCSQSVECELPKFIIVILADRQNHKAAGGEAMRTVTWLGCVALGLVLTRAAHAENIKIGFMVPYSGANADLGAVQDKAIDLYMKLHAKDIAPHTVEIIKRDEGPPSGANAKTVATELITRDKVNLLLGIVFSPSAIAMAPVVTQAKVPFIIANAGTAWITTLSPYIVRFSFSMWHDGYAMGTYASDKLKCKTAATAYTDFPPGKDSRKPSGPVLRRLAVR